MRPARTAVTGQNAVLSWRVIEAVAGAGSFIARLMAQPAIIMQPGFIPLLVFDPQSGQDLPMSQSGISAIAAA